MSWQDTVSGGFGAVDCILAGHPLDEQRAKETIKAAKAAGAIFDDYEKEIVWHCYKNVTAPGALQGHIADQVKTARKLW